MQIRIKESAVQRSPFHDRKCFFGCTHGSLDLRLSLFQCGNDIEADQGLVFDNKKAPSGKIWQLMARNSSAQLGGARRYNLGANWSGSAMPVGPAVAF